MRDPHEIALAALKKMREKEGPHATFPSDKIWLYAADKPDSVARPSAINWLRRQDYIEQTGRMTNAVTEARAGSKTPEYQFGPRFNSGRKANSAPVAIDIAELAEEFQSCCGGVLKVSESQALRLAAALLAKKLVLLTGLSGSGKTKLAQAFARWLTPQQNPNPRVAVIPVGADWTGNENILGYPDGLDAHGYVSRPALQHLLNARAEPNTPHFLILDEMNLSHVERYFADLLSAIESGEEIPLYEGGDRAAGAQAIPQKLRLPPNLFIIGTVNVDETTYMFSPKVLDRANVIEFRMERGDMESFLTAPVAPDLTKLDGLGAGFGKAFVTATGGPADVPAAVEKQFAAEMLLFFDILREHGAEFGFRVGHEASRFLHFYQKLGGFPENDKAWFDTAFDVVIIQKFLPKLHGSRSSLEGLLWALARACGAERSGKSNDEFLKECREAGKTQDETKFGPEVLEKALTEKQAKARYPLSFDKVLRMWRKLVRDQFASFAEA
jgi:energy-coupling factor transporter ATP-binding protein EcfA2